VAAIRLAREGFEWALAHACLSHFDPHHHADRTVWESALRSSPVRVQWDPERSLDLNPLPYRSLQVGLSGEAVDRYVDEWTVSIDEVTPLVREIRGLTRTGDETAALGLLPAERPYPLAAHLAAAVAADPA
jgi:hypothetical protein